MYDAITSLAGASSIAHRLFCVYGSFGHNSHHRNWNKSCQKLRNSSYLRSQKELGRSLDILGRSLHWSFSCYSLLQVHTSSSSSQSFGIVPKPVQYRLNYRRRIILSLMYL
eukprot:c22062_g1_i2 orf=181-513(+)